MLQSVFCTKYSNYILTVKANSLPARTNDTLGNEFEGFRKNSLSYCKHTDAEEESYPKIESAISACSKQASCYAVHDDSCDGKGQFKTCNRLENIVSGGIFGSCIYKKITGTLIYCGLNHFIVYRIRFLKYFYNY